MPLLLTFVGYSGLTDNLKQLLFIGILLLFLGGCDSKQPASKLLFQKNESESQVIDQPAAIFLGQNIDEKGIISGKEKNAIEKILTPFRIPVITSEDKKLEFIKQNGDIISLDIKTLPAKYDLILFNAVKDPFPCNYKDLSSAASLYFSENSQFQPSIRNFPPVGFHAVLSPDSSKVSEVRINKPIPSEKPKKVVIYRADNDSSSLKTRTFPGITFIENRYDSRTLLEVTFENDIITFLNTDRYFTNGVTISLQAPWIRNLRLSSLMIPYRNSAYSASSLKLVQNMYTPTDTRIAPALHNDRPYASYLYLGYSRTISDPSRLLRITSELDLGFTGPYSPGSYMQTLVHKTFPTNDKPLGWETQIRTDAIVNYNINVEKTLVNKDHFQLSGSVSAKAGSLYTQASTGIRIAAGQQISPYSPSVGKKQGNWQYSWYFETKGSFVGYDATLQGGIFNKENIFTLAPGDISRWVATVETGLQLRYKDSGLELAQHFLSPEYKGGMIHKWGRISLFFKL